MLLNVLTENAIAEMRGPEFLLVYFLFIVLVCLWAWYWARRIEFVSATVPVVPSRPDPYEVAFLRGGRRGLAEVICFSLIERGLLELTEDGRLIPGDTAAKVRGLNRDEEAVLAWVGAGRTAA